MNTSNPIVSERRPAIPSAPGAFTLVELLVVIGIIALLIALLLPSLGRARQAAQRTACAAKIQQMMIAASIHAVDHKGYWPLAGFLYGTGGYTTGDAMNDTYHSHYTYMGFQDVSSYTGNDVRILADIIRALGSEMGFKGNLAIYNNSLPTPAGVDRVGLARCFLCPSQASVQAEVPYNAWIYAGMLTDSLGVGTTSQTSYIFNEAVLGYSDIFGRLRGQASRVKQPSKTFFVADGQVGSTTSRPSGSWIPSDSPPEAYPAPWGTLTVWNNQLVGAYNNPITLSDVLTARTNPSNHGKLAGDAQNFDLRRHLRRMNIGFCDGHVETRLIPDTTKDPAATGLMDVYLIQP